jgi:hypothetical protein
VTDELKVRNISFFCSAQDLGLPFEENYLDNGKVPSGSSGVLIFVSDEFESSSVSYLNDLMTEQANALAKSISCTLLDSPGIIRLVSCQVVEELSNRLPTPDDVIREIVSFKRPVFSLALHKTRFTFTGFSNKDFVVRFSFSLFISHQSMRSDIIVSVRSNGVIFLFVQRYLTKLVHRMGGSVMQDTDSTTTHLVAKKALGPKYKYCKVFNVPVLKKEWIEDLWEASKNGNQSQVKVNTSFKT